MVDYIRKMLDKILEDMRGFSQLSNLNIRYYVLGFKSFSPTFLVAMYDNCRPSSHH